MGEKSSIGKELEARLETRVAEIRKHVVEVGEDYTSDMVLLFDALHCIRALRRRDPMQVEAEAIIRKAAQSIKQKERS